MKFDHIAIAVENLEASAEKWTHILGIKIEKIEEVQEYKIKVGFLRLNNGIKIELISPLSDFSPVKKFLEKRGEGLHHICFEVDDIKKTMEKLKEQGLMLIEEEPKKGAGDSLIVFIHPKSLNGVLIELKQIVGYKSHVPG